MKANELFPILLEDTEDKGHRNTLFINKQMNKFIK